MALAKQSIAIPLGEGVREGVGDRLVDPPSVLDLTDGRWAKRGEYAKRYGATTVLGPSSSTGQTVLEQGGSLVQIASAGVRAYDASTETWNKPNSAGPRPTLVETDPVIRGNGSYRDGDIAYDPATGLLALAYRDDAEDEIQVAMIEAATGTVIATRAGIPNDLEREPRIIAIDGRFVLLALDAGGSVWSSSYDPSAGTFSWGTAAEIHVGTGDEVCFDAHAAPGETEGHIAVALGTSGWAAYSIDKNGAKVSSLTASSSRTSLSIAVLHVPAVSRVYVLHHDTAPSPDQLSLDRFADDYTGTATKTKALDYAALGPIGAVFRCTLAYGSDGYLWAFASHDRCDGASIGGINWGALTSLGAAVSGTAGFYPGLILATKAATDSEGRVVVGCSREILFDLALSDIHPEPLPFGALMTPVTLTPSGASLAMVGRFGHDRIDCDGRSSVQTDRQIGSLVSAGGPLWAPYTALVSVGVLGATGTDLQRGFRWGIDALRLDPSPGRLRSTNAEGVAVVSGGETSCYDGTKHVEAVVPVVPHRHLIERSFAASGVGVTAPPNDYFYALGSTLTTNLPGTWDYVVVDVSHRIVLRWTDSQGNIHRSTPSEAYTQRMYVYPTLPPANIDGSAWDNAVSGKNEYRRVVLFPKPTPSALAGGENDQRIQVEIYRSGALYTARVANAGLDEDVSTWRDGDEAYRLVGVRDIGDCSAPNLGYVEDPVIDLTQDLSGAPLLYTEGGELGSEPLPPTLDVCSTQQRVFALEGEDRLSVRYSKPFAKGYAPEFNAALSIRCAAEGGDVVAIETLDDKLVLFKRSRIYVTPVLQGPDANGAGSAFYAPREIASDAGCVNRHSVAKGPFGVVFESQRGIYLLGRDLGLTWIGESVQDSLAGQTIVAATTVPSANEVRFMLASGSALVWEYRLQQWATWDNVPGVDSCVWRDRWTRIASDATATYEDPSTYEAPGTRPLLSLTTAWIKLAGLQGFKRVYRATLLGQHYTGHFAIDIGYDYEDTWTDTHILTEAELTALPDPLQITVRPSRQKVQSIRLRFREPRFVGAGQEVVSGTAGRGTVVQGLQLEVGMRPGLSYRLNPVAQKR